MPAPPAEEPVTVEPVKVEPGVVRNTRVLVVDDNPSMGELVQDVTQKFQLRAQDRSIRLEAHLNPQAPPVTAEMFTAGHLRQHVIPVRRLHVRFNRVRTGKIKRDTQSRH